MVEEEHTETEVIKFEVEEAHERRGARFKLLEEELEELRGQLVAKDKMMEIHDIRVKGKFTVDPGRFWILQAALNLGGPWAKVAAQPRKRRISDRKPCFSSLRAPCCGPGAPSCYL